jgi:hypothetical protein
MKSTGMSVEKLMGRMFRRVDNVVWDLMTGKLGVRTRDGEIATCEGEGESATISINPFEDFGIAIPAFAQATPIDAVKVGDLIYTSTESPGWIIEIKSSAAKKSTNPKSFRLIRAGGNLSSWIPPKVQMFGLDGGVLVVRSLISMLPGGNDGLAGLQGSLMPLMMLGGDNLDLDKMLPLMLMSQAGGNSAFGGGMMQALMMSKLLGGSDLLGSGSKPIFRG